MCGRQASLLAGDCQDLSSTSLPLPSPQVDIGQGRKPPGYYVQRSNGLFPAPWPQDCPELSIVCKRFELLGMFLAKCLQDGRRVDLPLSPPFFKMLCSATPSTCSEPRLPSPAEPEPHTPSPAEPVGGEDVEGEEVEEEEEGEGPEDELAGSNRAHRSPSPSGGSSPGDGLRADSAGAGSKETEVLLPLEEIPKEGEGKPELVLQELEVAAGASPSPAWFAGTLGLDDLVDVDPFRARFLLQLRVLASERERVAGGDAVSPAQRERLLAELSLPGAEENLPGPHLQDLW